MKRMMTAVLVLAVAGCDPAAVEAPKPPAPPPPSAPAVSGPPLPAPLLDPTHPEATAIAPSEFRAKFETSKGDFTVFVYRAWSPRGADRFYNLVRNGFYDETRFFRVVTDFVVQFGLAADPRVTAAWEKSNLIDDPVVQNNVKGMLCYAKSSAPHTRTTQIFINLKDNARLDGTGFSAFGKILEGMDVVEAITAQYGELPDQERIRLQGNEYLKREFPNLDYVKKARILP